jgi:hypothetical protein
MKRMPVLLIGLLLLALLAGTVPAAAEVTQPLAQRVTATATPALRIPVTLVVLPLPATIEAAPTTGLVVTPLVATPIVTGTLMFRVTPVITATTSAVRATPTPTARVRITSTPTSTTAAVPAAADSETGIVDFRATTSRVRGQIQLSWRYLGDNVDGGGFVVERSTNGGAWRFVADCALPFDGDIDLYRCRDTGLYSGSSYAYRICIAQEVPACAGAVVVETEPVKAP